MCDRQHDAVPVACHSLMTRLSFIGGGRVGTVELASGAEDGARMHSRSNAAPHYELVSHDSSAVRVRVPVPFCMPGSQGFAAWGIAGTTTRTTLDLVTPSNTVNLCASTQHMSGILGADFLSGKLAGLSRGEGQE